jgi:hypothetical protein
VEIECQEQPWNARRPPQLSGLMKFRSTLISSLLLFGSLGGLVMADSLEGSGVSEISKGQFSYNYYNHRPEVIEYFESKGYQGGGYTWEGLARAGSKLSGSKLLSLVEFDPEGDALYAYSSSKPALDELEAMVKRIAANAGFRDKCIELAIREGILE